jgi:GT2 family glycosyltransferase
MRTDASIKFTMVSNSLVYEAREEIARQFMDSDCEYLFFLDNDMTFDPRTPLLLARHKRDIVTAKAFKRVRPYAPCFYTKLDIRDDGKQLMEVPIQYGDGLLPIEGCGMACCLIHRSVFERTPKPWFFPMPQFGEDLAFCYRARQAGVELFCDTTIQCGHLGISQVIEGDFQQYIAAQKAAGKTVQEAMGL